MLLTADSGGGKTFAIKRIVEEASGKIQIFIVDPEGEFAPLREHFNFVLVGPRGETPADVRSAETVGQTLLKLGASAIFDIYEMKPTARHEWVSAFLNGLIEAPKQHRHPCLVIVDEAHMFCPERGKGESIATEAMRDLCTRGRKRLLCALFATQRLATLNKDASSMLLNRMIGPTFEDLNRKRAAEVLSVTKENMHEFNKQIQLLEPGYFFALGRAISRERVLVHIGGIRSAHGQEALKYELSPPPPPEKIKALLPKLADLPKQAEEQAKTAAEFKAQIRSLKAQLRAQPAAASKTVEVKVADPRAIDRAVRQVREEYDKQFAEIRAYQRNIYNPMVKAWELLGKVIDLKAPVAMARTELQLPVLPKIPGGEIQKKEAFTQKGEITRRQVHPRPEMSSSPENNVEITRPQQAIIRALAEFAAIGRSPVPKTWVAARAGASHKSSSYGNNLGALRAAGWIDYAGGGAVHLTAQGKDKAPIAEPPANSEEMLERCLKIVTRPQGEILKVAHHTYPETVGKEELAAEAGTTMTSSSFGNNLGALRSAGMIEYISGGVKAADWLFVD